jgi:hypothetical protein
MEVCKNVFSKPLADISIDTCPPLSLVQVCKIFIQFEEALVLETSFIPLVKCVKDSWSYPKSIYSQEMNSMTIVCLVEDGIQCYLEHLLIPLPLELRVIVLRSL